MSYPVVIPILNSPVGASLTPDNWVEAGVSSAACQLQSLLIKPGLLVLRKLTDLRSWFAWSAELWLDLELPESVDGQIKLISPYDGQRISLSLQEISQLVGQWPYLQKILPQTNRAFWQTQDLAWSERAPTWSDEPTAEGLAGFFRTISGTHSIGDSQYIDDFSLLDPACCCPSCKQGFTRAYLHHLYAHTPLLAQRFLIQHNIYQVTSS